jgi:predicted branched-subunit amino acid permease
MPKPSIRRAFWQGFRDGAPFLLVVVPFGMLFGALAAEAGWNIAEIMAASILIIAGASQFTMLQLMSENAPTLIVIGTALAVNLRMAMYSAALAPHIGAAPLWQRALAAYFLDMDVPAARFRACSRLPNASGCRERFRA